MSAMPATLASTNMETIRIPQFPRLSTLADDVEKNRAINTWYHAVDLMLRDYLGTPELPNWATFGKHVSDSAGAQLQDLDRIIRILDGANTLINGGYSGIADAKLILHSIGAIAKNGFALLWNNVGKLSQLASVTEATCDLLQVIDQQSKGITAVNGSCDNEVGVAEFLRLLETHHDTLTLKLRQISEALKQGNCQIYEYMSENVTRFVDACNKNPADPLRAVTFIDDARGLFHGAFERYAEAHNLSRQMAYFGEHSVEYHTLNAKRIALVREANLFLVFNEQSSRVQPLYDKLLNEMDAITNDAQLYDPIGAFPLLPHFRAGNWADIYTRMGIDRSTAPENHAQVSAQNFPQLLPPDDNRFAGTIGAYFERALQNGQICLKLRSAPRSCAL